jgi:hypothetical protein
VNRYLALAALNILAGVGVAYAYPTQGNQPLVAPPGYDRAYGPKAAEISQGDLIFADHYPSVLSDAELFTLFGSDSNKGKKGYRGLLSELLTVLENYVAETGSIPPAITDEVIRVAYGHAGQKPKPTTFEMLRSTINGRYPRLDAANFSAGDFYVRVLTPDEVKTMSEWDDTLRRALAKQKTKLLTKVYYMRAYGEREVIFGGLKYAFTE